MVPEGRFELPWVAPADFESAASAVPPLRPVGRELYRNVRVLS